MVFVVHLLSAISNFFRRTSFELFSVRGLGVSAAVIVDIRLPVPSRVALFFFRQRTRASFNFCEFDLYFISDVRVCSK